MLKIFISDVLTYAFFYFKKEIIYEFIIQLHSYIS